MPTQDFSDMLVKARILIVDDDAELCRILTKAFSQEGYTRVDSVDDGRGAMRRILESVDDDDPYDLVVLDLMLPGEISGEAVYQNLSSTLDILIVVLTAVGEKESQLQALKTLAVEDYLVKPFDVEVLLLRCERILLRRVFGRQMELQSRRTQKLFLNVLQVMAKVLEAKDPYTRFHSENVAKYARQIARRMGYDSERLELIQMAGILHDFGKIGVKEAVLNKPGSLTEEEYLAIKRHPLIASAILEPIDELRTIIRDIRHHHERFDGRGYPDGVAGEDIPLGARILCVADAYDAMTSARSYHEPKSEEEAVEEMQRCAGSQFDPKIVENLVAVVHENAERRRRMMRLRRQVEDDPE